MIDDRTRFRMSEIDPLTSETSFILNELLAIVRHIGEWRLF